MPKGSRRRRTVDTGEFPVINIGNRLDVEAHRRIHRHEREYCASVCYEYPSDSSLRVSEQCAHALEGQNDDNPLNDRSDSQHG